MIKMVICISILLHSVQQKPLDEKDTNVHKLPNNVWKTKGPDKKVKEQLTQNIFETRLTTLPFISSSNDTGEWKTNPTTTLQDNRNQHSDINTRRTKFTTEHSFPDISEDYFILGSRTNASVANQSNITNICKVIGAVIVIILLF